MRKLGNGKNEVVSQEDGVTETAVEAPVRNSEAKKFRRCLQAWQWAYVERWSSDRVRGALTFGKGVHRALELYYPPGTVRGPHPAGNFEKWFQENNELFAVWDDEGQRHDPLELGMTMLEEYVKEYGPEDHIRIIAPEMPFRVPIYDKRGNFLRTFVGRGDALYEDRSLSNKKKRRLGFLEHKTGKTIEEGLRINSGYGDQAIRYAWAASIVLRDLGVIGEHENVDHTLMNWLKKTMPTERFRDPVTGLVLNKPGKDALLSYCAAHGIIDTVTGKAPKTAGRAADLIDNTGYDHRKLGEESKVQPTPILFRERIDFGDDPLHRTGWRIMAEAYTMQQYREGKLPITINPTKDCHWECEFVDVCELREMGEDWESMLHHEFVPGDPYEDYEMETK